jgi:ureidoacrylate peracid hydrolase
VRDLATVLLSDGCAAFSPQLHETAVAALRPVTAAMTIAEALAELSAS